MTEKFKQDLTPEIFDAIGFLIALIFSAIMIYHFMNRESQPNKAGQPDAIVQTKGLC